MMIEQKHIFLIDDDDSVRNALSRVLTEYGYLVEEFSKPKIFLENFNPKSPSVILLDMQMPEMNGVELQNQLITRGITTPIIFISGNSHPKQIVQGLKSGAVDFIFKPFETEDLLVVIEKSIKIDRDLYQKFHKTRIYKEYLDSLSSREKEVSQFLVTGLMNIQIAKLLGISEATVKVHKARVMSKMNVASLQDLVKIYAEMGLLD